MKIDNINMERIKKGGLVLSIGAVITGAITTNNILNKQDVIVEPERVKVVIEETSDDSRYANDVITFVDEDSSVQAIINGKRSKQTEIEPGMTYHVYSYELDDYQLELEVPSDEDELSLVIDYDEKTITPKGLGRNK